MQIDETSSRSYFRWQHERSPYAIELSVEMAARLLLEIHAAQRAGKETGGLLIGSFPKTKNLTLRIDDYFVIARSEADSSRYDLSAKERAVLSTTRHRLIDQQTPVLGFFRSDRRGDRHNHWGDQQRDQGLLLSAEDRSLLNLEFRRAIHVALLVSATEPHSAAFFVPDLNGDMQDGPPLSEFLFDPEDLAGLAAPLPQSAATSDAKTPNEVTTGRNTPATRHRGVEQRSIRWAKPWLWCLAATVIMACLFLTAWAPTTMRLFGKGQSLGLAINSRSHVLELRWNQHYPDLLRASAATLTVTDGAVQREWSLSSREMRLGSVAYQRHGARVSFALSLHLPDSMELVQSVTWPNGRPSRP
jgi:hypothetical protein